jgi:hypothetical protein
LRLNHDSPALRTEMIEVLTGLPELLPEPPSVPLEPGALYEDAARSDLALLDALADRLFGPGLPGFGPISAQNRVALMTSEACEACKQAEADLRDLSEVYDLRVTLFNADENADLLELLGLDMVPSYVFPDQMLRGAIPAIVLERYLSD